MKTNLYFEKINNVASGFLFLFICLFSNFYFAQTIAATNGTATPCGNCAPPNWADNTGTPDISNSTVAATTAAGGGGGANWTQTPGGTVNFTLPTPPNTHTTWLSLRDLGGAGTQESVTTTVAGLTIGRTYEIVVFSLTAVTRNNGSGGNVYAGTYITQFFAEIAGQTLQVTGITTNTWTTSKIRFTATATSHTLLLRPGNIATAGTPTAPIFSGIRTIQISVTASTAGNSASINTVPVAVADNAQTLQNAPVSFNVVSNDTDVNGSIVASTVDLDPGTPGIQTTFTTAGTGTWTVTGGVVTFTPVSTFLGTATIPYTVDDNFAVNGVSAPATSQQANITVLVSSAADADGDGIVNSLDLDDDNDGILDTVEDSCVKPNQIVNGDFSSSATSWAFSYSTTTPNTSGPLTFTGTAADIFVDNPGTLYPGNILLANTTPFVTAAGATYSFTSTLNILGGTTNTSFSWVLIDSSNNIVQTLQTYKTQASGVGTVTITNTVTAYPVTFVAAGTGSHRLALTWITNSATSGNAQDVRIDNVSLLSPCDFDGDGIPNIFDLDSDNDGCFDAIEGAENVLSSQLSPNGSINFTANGGLGTTAGTNNGVPNLVNSGGTADTGSATAGTVGQPIGRSQNASQNDCIDSDADGVPDWQDLDDDNDGILDTLECGFVCATPFINGGFEFPVVSGIGVFINQNTPGVGWKTTATDGLIEFWQTGAVPSAEGAQFAELNATQVSTLYQTFCLNGTGGTINWSAKHRGRNGVDVAAVKFGSTVATAQASTAVQNMSDGNTAWGSYSGTYTIPAGTTSLVIAFQAVSSAGGDAGQGNFLDDVQIVINQSCLDTDGDGIPNSLDLDSDDDGCPDVIEGSASFVNGASYISANNRLTTPVSATGIPGVPSATPAITGYSATAGQTTIGDSQNNLVNNCFCYKNPASPAGGNPNPVRHGITALNRANSGTSDWPVVRRSAWTVLESKSKGFVVNRMAFVDADNNAATPTTPPLAAIPAANYVEGMMIYDTVANCLKIYNGTLWNCYNVQSCPDF
ncbi:hypothetical protein NZ698_13525 [Chryseobacterium sp. PBS4-4]|uniref:Tandem-95 repeat protein n=1 Tax=Chryseobacterium edaphi TaxID=2976532 RepID=A0ABT2W8C4_9FLAO|nr:Ig-like domain-containing protein [Chryseobacterium edaphi]MCU7618224.1 hypothetical protein [Chryseobacterium edaphi]